ncbi:MAG: hypothetical protein M3285_13450 [Actinomycetota bacterium]|nr:hypothetical protein [Actinomycetota bacterium]MDQ3956544.1 hypothetical protein [Actinomycetota bacterium]
MAVITYSYFPADFPALEVNDSIKSVTQLAMPWGDHQAHTTLTFQGSADAEEFERYRIEHQLDRDIDAIWNQQHIHRVIEVKEFHAYYYREKHYALVDTKKVDARSAMSRLNDGVRDIKVGKLPDIPLAAMEKIQGGVTAGGYFGKLKIAKVKSAALFGEEVSESADWQRYEEAGELSALFMRAITPEDLERTLLLTHARIIVLYTNEGEAKNLRFVARLQEEIDNTLRELDSE